MDSGLYDMDMDLSLFGGDLLHVGIEPTPADVFKAPEDGPQPWSPSHLTVSSVLEPATLLSYPGFGTMGGADEPWMDSRVDLLHLMEEPVLTSSDELVDQVDVTECNTDEAIKVLESIAEETAKSLTTEKQESSQEDVTEFHLEDGVKLEASAEDLLRLLESNSHLLSHTADEDDSGVVDDFFSASALETSLMEGPVLSPISADDVDSILSSSPPSPLGHTSTKASSGPDVSSSLLAHYLISDTVTVAHTARMEQVEEEEDDDPDYVPPGKARRVTKSGKSAGRPQAAKPYERKIKPAQSSPSRSDKQAILMERKLRKKQQNKEAAIRYREKKKAESATFNGECDQLEEINSGLRDKVDSMTREVSYLKNLLAEVYRARGLIK